jgi:hypothetical protein
MAARQAGQSDGATRLYELEWEDKGALPELVLEGEDADLTPDDVKELARRLCRLAMVLPGEASDGGVQAAHAFVAEGRHRLVTSYDRTAKLRLWDLGEASCSSGA